MPSSPLERLPSSFSGCRYPQITFPWRIPLLPVPLPGDVVAAGDTQKVPEPLSWGGDEPQPGQGRERDEFFSPGALLSPQLISHARSSRPCWGQILSLASKAKTTGEKMLKEGSIPESFPPFPCTSSIPLRLLFFVLFSKLQFPALTLWKRGFAKAFGRLHLLCGFPRTRPQGKQDSSNSYIIKRSAAFLLR